MKFKFSWKTKEASMEADVEGMVEKGLEYKSKRPEKKTRYQIKEEEKRKTAELQHKIEVQKLVLGFCIMLGFVLVMFAICIIGMSLE